MKLCVGTLLLFGLVSTGDFWSLGTSLNWGQGTPLKHCSGPGFVKVACDETLVKQTFQGQSGVKGPQGVHGMPGPIGETGKAASFCKPRSVLSDFKKVITMQKVNCDNDHYFDFIRTRHDIRWMDHVLYILYGHDINHLTKDELMKVVITQNTKILDDSSDLDKYHKNITDLNDKMQAQERDFNRQIEQVKTDCSKKDEQLKSLHSQITTLGKDVKTHNAVVFKLDEANGKVLKLTKELKDKQDALLKQKNDLTKQISDKVAENVKLNTQLVAIKFNLTSHIKNENMNNVKHVETKKKLEEAKATCEKNIADKLKEIAALKVKEVELMKHHKATKDQSDLISALKTKLAELMTKRITSVNHAAPPLVSSAQLLTYDGDSGVTVTRGNAAVVSTKTNLQAHFRIVRGLDGANNTVSFESLSKPGNYLTAEMPDFLLKLNGVSPAHFKMASFVPKKNIFVQGTNSFELAGQPGRYMTYNPTIDMPLKMMSVSTMKDAEISEIPDDEYKKACSFKIDTYFDHGIIQTKPAPVVIKPAPVVKPQVQPTHKPAPTQIHLYPNTVFDSYNFPNHKMGIENEKEGFLTQKNPDFQHFKVVPGISRAPGSISFESIAKPGYFLRHRNSLIYLHRIGTSHEKDATFYPRYNKYFPGFVAYESVNLPSFYIRHSGKDEQRLKVDKDDNSDQFKKDASWKTVQTEEF